MGELPRTKVRWGVKRRLEFIDFRLFWDGRFNRHDLVDTFGISPQQATADVSQYEREAPENLIYDRGQKAYLRTASFTPAFSAERYLLELVAIDNQWLRREDTWFEALPSIEFATLRQKTTEPTILLRILDAIRDRQHVELKYASVSGSPAPLRSISPHALAYTGGGWYARAWSGEHNDFRDYKLNRITGIDHFKPSNIDPSLDFEWAHKIDLKITPNPRLSADQRAAVAADYDMIGDELTLTCRLSLSFYLMSTYNLDVPDGTLDPKKQQLVLTNRAEVLNARETARKLAKEALLRATVDK
ncbi:MAG: WYL domain-containing protein [Enhydrobacter sp.]|nr:WYL domain-containing protein [Enhydrobacter sp.]